MHLHLHVKNIHASLVYPHELHSSTHSVYMSLPWPNLSSYVWETALPSQAHFDLPPVRVQNNVKKTRVPIEDLHKLGGNLEDPAVHRTGRAPGEGDATAKRSGGRPTQRAG